MPAEGNLLRTLHAAAVTRLDRPFLIEPHGATASYGEVFDLGAAMAAVLADHGVRPGDRVLSLVDKSPAAVAFYVACLHAGAVFVPLNPRFTATEVDYFIGDARPALVVVDDTRERHPGASGTPPVITLAALENAARTDATPAPITDRAPDALAAILYTSGTTGRPKGAALTHDNLRHNARALHQIWHFDGDDHLLHTLPIFHVHGLFVALHCAMLAAIPVTFLPRFDVDGVIAALPSASVLMGVPTHYKRLLDDPRFDADLTARTRLFTSGSAPLPDAVFDAFTARTGHRICERYGMSEAGIIASNPYDGDRLAGTVGFPLPGVELRICDRSGTPLAAGVTGTVEVRGPHLFPGYWDRPDATTAAHHGDGWFITGDIGSLDDDGRLTLQGRAGDMIISGGENIYPKEIELVLDRVPGVVESAVIGLTHPDFGEGVTAVLVVNDGYTEAAVRAALDDTLARFKHPKALITVDELPRNTMGKVQKNLLRSRLSGHYTSAG